MSVKHPIVTIVSLVAVIHHFTTSSSTNSHISTFAPSVMAYQTVTRPMRTFILKSTASTTNTNIAHKSRVCAGSSCHRKNNILLFSLGNHVSSSRLFSRGSSNPKRGDNDDDENKIVGKLQKWFSKAADKVKSILPSSWASSGEENKSIRKSTRQRQSQQQQEEISSSLDSLFRDSPLGIRLMGNMIVKPLFSSLAGSLAQTMQEQQREISDLLEEARTLILYDKSLVASLGGEPIQVSPPFSQSSSTSTVSISGGRMERRSRVEASFEVTGGRGSYPSGVATMVAVNGVMERLYVNLQGRYYEVHVGGRTTTGTSSTVVVMEGDDGVDDIFTSRKAKGDIGKNHKQGGGKDDIIDAEFVDKKVYKK